MPQNPDNTSSASNETGRPRRILRLHEAITLIVGLVIGAGIFKTPAVVANLTGETGSMFSAWILGGLVSLVGALCYAELACAYPDAGGDYHFLQKAYGRSISFLFGWARLSVITTGSIALLAFVFGDYMNRIIPLDIAGTATGPFLYAIAVIFILSWANIRNIRTGMATQSLFTGLQVLSLVLIVATAFYLLAADTSAPASTTPLLESSGTSPLFSANFGLAMVFVLLTFGGWNEAAYISAELKDGHRNMVRALVFSIGIITALYLLVTWAYWQGLGFTGMATSPAIAADLMQMAFGNTAQKSISLMVAISTLTSINATIIVGARTSYAMGRDWHVLRKLGVWDARRDTPVNALYIQCLASLALVVLGTLIGSGFKSMVEFTAPVFWLFFLLSGISLFVLRIRDPHTPRPFRVPFYPFLPLIFCLTCSYMLWSSLSYVYDQSLGGINAAWIGVAVLLPGLVFLWIINRIDTDKKQTATTADT